MQLALAAIRQNGGTQPREALNFGAVDSYAEDMAAGASFPPVVVFFDGADYWLADGFHRVLAAKKNSQGTIDAEVHQGTQADAQWYSYSANRTNGLLRTSKDKARAVKAALEHPRSAGMSDEALASHIGVHRQTVLHYRNSHLVENRQDTRTVSRNGKTYQQNTTNIGKATRQPKAQKPPTPESAAPVFTPIQELPIAEPNALVQEVDRLVNAYGWDDLCQLVGMLAERVGLEVRG